MTDHPREQPLTLADLQALPRSRARLSLHNRYRQAFHEIFGVGPYAPVSVIPPSRTDLVAFYDSILDGQRDMFREDFPLT